MEKTTATPIYFIVGAGRSGSTLLQLMFDAHPNTIAPIESRFIIFLYEKYASVKNWTQEKLTQFYTDLFYDEKIYYLWELDKKQLQKDILSQPENTNFGNLCKIVFKNYISFFKKKKAKVIIDKNPINSLFIPWLLKVFPNAKFIHLIRDPRASCYSHVKAGMQPNPYAAALMWRDYNKAIEKSKQKHPERFETVFYEDLVKNPNLVLTELTTFLNIDFKEELLKFNQHFKSDFINKLKTAKQSKKSLKQQLFHKYHNNLQKPISDKYINSWQTKLTAKNIQVIEEICNSLMQHYNYSFSTKYLQKNYSSQLPMHYFKKFLIKFYYAAPLSLRLFYTHKINSNLKPKLFFSIRDRQEK